jgi:hypothetical protein
MGRNCDVVYVCWPDGIAACCNHSTEPATTAQPEIHPSLDRSSADLVNRRSDSRALIGMEIKQREKSDQGCRRSPDPSPFTVNETNHRKNPPSQEERETRTTLLDCSDYVETNHAMCV